MIHVEAYGTGVTGVTRFRLVTRDGDQWVHAGSFTLAHADIPALIEDLSDWLPDPAQPGTAG